MYAFVKQYSHYALLLQEEDPLNSDDDVSDDDPADLFDTDNVVVCQFDKVRVSNGLFDQVYEFQLDTG